MGVAKDAQPGPKFAYSISPTCNLWNTILVWKKVGMQRYHMQLAHAWTGICTDDLFLKTNKHNIQQSSPTKGKNANIAW